MSNQAEVQESRRRLAALRESCAIYDWEQMEVEARALEALGDAALAPIVEAMEGDLRYDLAHRLGDLVGSLACQSAEALEVLSGFCEHPHWLVRSAAVSGYGQILRAGIGLEESAIDWLMSNATDRDCDDEVNYAARTIVGEGISEQLFARVAAMVAPGSDVGSRLLGFELLSGNRKEEVLEVVRPHLGDPLETIRLGAVQALRWHPQIAELFPELVVMLDEPSPGLREEVICALGQCYGGASQAAPLLVELLQREEEPMACRIQAAEALAQIDPAGSVGPVLGQLQLEDPLSPLFGTLMRALLSMSPHSIEPVLDQLNHPRLAWHLGQEVLQHLVADIEGSLLAIVERGEEPSRTVAIETLGARGHDPVAPALAAFFIYPQEEILQYTTQRALAKMGDQAAGVLASFAQHDDPSVRLRVAECLGQMRRVKERVEAPLLQLFEDEDQGVKEAAALSLAGLELASPEAALVSLSMPGSHRSWAMEQVLNIGESIAPALENELFSDSHELRCQAAEALGQMRVRSAAHSLFVALEQEYDDGLERAEMIKVLGRALGQIGGPEVIEGLIGLLSHRSWDCKVAAARALGEVGKDAVEPLLCALATPDPDVQSMAADALGQIGAAEAAEPLLQLLFCEHAGVQKKAATALGRLDFAFEQQELIATLRALLGYDASEQRQQATLKFVKLIPVDEDTAFIVEYIREHIRQSWPKEVSFRMMKRIDKALRSR